MLEAFVLLLISFGNRNREPGSCQKIIADVSVRGTHYIFHGYGPGAAFGEGQKVLPDNQLSWL